MLDRLGAAPISWGICEAPGWGRQLPVDRVLDEMSSLGIRATELGAIGWLPTEPTAIRAKLQEHNLALLGGFVPLVLHDPDQFGAYRSAAIDTAKMMSSAGGTNFVTAIVSDPHDWQRPALDEAAWNVLMRNLAEIDMIVSDHGMTQVVHPHVDTLVETVGEVTRFLNDSDVMLCLDTGHLHIGGADPVAIAGDYAERVGLVHIKDVDNAVAARLRAGELTLMTATQAGLFPVVGSGDVAVADAIRMVEGTGYRGWYVIEQDVAITEGEPPLGEGPIEGISRSIAYIRALAADAGWAS